MSPNLVAMVTHCLRWVLLLETWRPAALESVSATLKFSRLLCTFLSGLFVCSFVFGQDTFNCVIPGLLTNIAGYAQ